MSPKQQIRKTLEDLRPLLSTDWRGDGVRVTEAVVVAVDEALAELDKPRSNWYRVATLLTCKSYLCGALAENEPFCEDRDHNEAVMGEGISVYSILDGLQFKAATLADVMPAGLTVYTAEGKSEEKYALDADGPTLRNIALADQRVRERCGAAADGTKGTE